MSGAPGCLTALPQASPPRLECSLFREVSDNRTATQISLFGSERPESDTQ